MSRGKIAHAWGQCMRRLSKPKFSGVQGIRYLSCMALFHQHGPPKVPSLVYAFVWIWVISSRSVHRARGLGCQCGPKAPEAWPSGRSVGNLSQVCKFSSPWGAGEERLDVGAEGRFPWHLCWSVRAHSAWLPLGVEQLRRKYLSPHVWHADLPHSNFLSESCSVHVVFSH